MQHGDGLFREIRKRALAQGWRVEPTAGGHIRFVPPDPRHSHVIASSTPSRGRGLKHLVSDLKRRGFSNKPARPERARTERAPTFDQAAEISPATATTITPTPEKIEKEPSDMTTNATDTQPSTIDVPVGAKTEFKDALRSARKAEGLSAEAVAELLKVSPAAIYAWEKGTCPGVESYQKLCDLFDALRDAPPPRDPRSTRSGGGCSTSPRHAPKHSRDERGPWAVGAAGPSDGKSGTPHSAVAEALRLFTGLRGIARDSRLLDLLIEARAEGLELNDVIEALR